MRVMGKEQVDAKDIRRVADFLIEQHASIKNKPQNAAFTPAEVAEIIQKCTEKGMTLKEAFDAINAEELSRLNTKGKIKTLGTIGADSKGKLYFSTENGHWKSFRKLVPYLIEITAEKGKFSLKEGKIDRLKIRLPEDDEPFVLSSASIMKFSRQVVEGIEDTKQAGDSDRKLLSRFQNEFLEQFESWFLDRQIEHAITRKTMNFTPLNFVANMKVISENGNSESFAIRRNNDLYEYASIKNGKKEAWKPLDDVFAPYAGEEDSVEKIQIQIHGKSKTHDFPHRLSPKMPHPNKDLRGFGDEIRRSASSAALKDLSFPNYFGKFVSYTEKLRNLRQGNNGI